MTTLITHLLPAGPVWPLCADGPILMSKAVDPHWFLIFPVPPAFSQCSLPSMSNPTFNFSQPFSHQPIGLGCAQTQMVWVPWPAHHSPLRSKQVNRLPFSAQFCIWSIYSYGEQLKLTSNSFMQVPTQGFLDFTPFSDVHLWKTGAACLQSE